MGEAGSLAAELPPAPLPGRWSIPGSPWLYQVADFLQSLPIRRLQQGHCRKKKTCEQGRVMGTAGGLGGAISACGSTLCSFSLLP